MLGGGSSNRAQPTVVYSGLKVSTSQFDVPKQIFWGRRRLTWNAIDYVNFKAKKVGNKKSGGGKKGGGQLYTYSASVVLALGEGPLDQVKRAFASGTTSTPTTLAALNATLFSGTSTQTAWSYLTTNFPTHALAYRNTIYIGIPNMDLGYTPSIPDNHFECDRANSFSYTHTTNGWINPVSHVQDADAIDCLPSDVLNDLLTNTRYGMGFSASDIDSYGLAIYANYCRAQGIFFSPLLVNQEKATSLIDRWAQLSNSWIFWTGTKLAIVPLGDSSVTANGATYTPNNSVAAALSVANGDFLGDPPATVTRKDPADCYNRTRIDFCDRTLGYITNTTEYKDQTLVDQYGVRDNSSVQADEICDPPVAEIVKVLVGKRAAYIRNTYKWKSPFKRILLLPGDIVTLTEPNIGLNATPVRITGIAEGDDGSLDFDAEEYPGIVGNYATVNSGSAGASSFPSLYVTPDSVNTPAIIEPDSAFTGGVPILIIAASGTNNWGGCVVNISFDGTNWTQIGTISQPATQGTLTGTLADHADPDTGNTLAVDTTESNVAVSTSITHADADAGRTVSLIAVQPTLTSGVYVMPTNGEMLSPGSCSATGTFTANLTYLRRAQYGTAHSSHSSGDQFTMVDVFGISGTSVRYQIPAQYIGATLYFKLQSFNQFGQSLQALGSCNEYSYVPTGLGYGTGSGGVPATPTGLSLASVSATTATLTWNANAAADNVTSYLVYRAAGTGASFGSASLISTVSALSFTDSGLSASTGYTYFLEAKNAVGSSSATTGVNATTSSGSPANTQLATLTYIIDGGSSAITSGLKLPPLEIQFAGTINSVTLLADVSGSVEVDIWKCTYSQYDAGSTHPVVGDSITASAVPTISSATKYSDTTLTGWTTSIALGDILAFNVVSGATSITKVTVTLKVTKT